MAASNKVSSTLGAGLTRHDFPKDFLFGAATSSYQIEGAYKNDGKSHNNWDVYAVQKPEKIMDGTNGCDAIDHYNRFKEDVLLMKKLGLDCYRLSLSWSRILPAGRLSGGVNREGVRFYNDLIDLLLSQGIEPVVTIFHFDVPQFLEDEYGGFLCEKIIDDFADYAKVCFFEFGDRVKYWITENEPWTFTHNGYVNASFPPAHGTSSATTALDANSTACLPYRCPRGIDTTCHGGNAGTEPYIVAHNLILAHATAVDIYRKNFQGVQGGKIGVTNMTTWFEPYNPKSQLDVEAASRAVDFMWGWFMAPIVTGDYPPVMRERVQERLPTFTDDQKKLITKSYDFIGLNYYTSNWAANEPTPPGTTPTYYTDRGFRAITKREDGTLIGKQAGSEWLFIVPEGIYKLLVHTKTKYGDPDIYITENGVNEVNNRKQSLTKALKDDIRIQYHQDHLAYVKHARDNDGVKVKGYMLWSLFDNYEWAEGYTVRFGMCFVDFVNGLARYPKDSFLWYMNFLNKKLLPGPKRQVQEIEEDTPVKRKRTR